MSKLLTRRKLITTGLATAAGASGLAVAARLAGRVWPRVSLDPPCTAVSPGQTSPTLPQS